MIYHIYIFVLISFNSNFHFYTMKNYILISLLLFLITYFIICDSNPFFCLIAFYIFYPCFIKAVLIIFVHTYFLSIYINNMNHYLINLNSSELSLFNYKFNRSSILKSYFLSDIFNHFKLQKHSIIVSISLIIFIMIDITLFLNKTYLRVYFNNKDKTLPILSSKNTTFYITSNIFNMENTIEVFISEMKKLINYLGENNVIISIIENGDSKDNTRIFLEKFQNYLNDKKILNKFVLNHEIDDQRKEYFSTLKYTRFRIEYYSKLRNRCLDFLYELSNFDFNNTMILFFNDIIFHYEDIINLLSTNNEDYDAVCGLDMSFLFYDRWVSIDLEGEGMSKYFPYFVNKEGQDLVINHKPVRVFSCWNGVIAFKALPLKDKKIQFRHKLNYSLPRNVLKNPSKTYYESECTYFNVDLYSLGFTKKFINPDVRVAYKSNYLWKAKNYIPSFKHIANYFWLYFEGLTKKRNKAMSNYIDNGIELNSELKNWYYDNRIIYDNY